MAPNVSTVRAAAARVDRGGDVGDLGHRPARRPDAGHHLVEVAGVDVDTDDLGAPAARTSGRSASETTGPGDDDDFFGQVCGHGFRTSGFALIQAPVQIHEHRHRLRRHVRDRPTDRDHHHPRRDVARSTSTGICHSDIPPGQIGSAAVPGGARTMNRRCGDRSQFLR